MGIIGHLWLFAAFPVAYEVIFIILKALSVRGILHMPAAAYPFLPVKKNDSYFRHIWLLISLSCIMRIS